MDFIELFLIISVFAFFCFSPVFWGIGNYFEAKSYYWRERAHELAIKRGKVIREFSLFGKR